MINHALEYQKKGYSVIPVGKNKKPLIHWKKYQSIRATPEQIKKWWQQFPTANIGIVTGQISNLSVLDIDPDNKGVSPKGIPLTLTAKTQSGGYHYYFQYHKGLPNMAGTLQGVDIRSEGGYVIAPPSEGERGEYQWVVEETLAPFPSSLLPKNIKKNNWNKLVKGSSFGERNDNATKIIGKLISKHPQEEWDTLVWELIDAWNTKNTPPLSQEELKTTFHSICSREINKQISLIKSPLQLTDKSKFQSILTSFSDTKNPLNNMASVCVFFENYAPYKNIIKYNLFRRQIEIGQEELTDQKLLEIVSTVQSLAIPNVTRETTHHAIQHYAFNNSYDEAKEYLQSLEWDKTPRLEQWLISTTGIEDDPDKYHRAVGVQWFMGMVRRMTYPGCIFDHALVLSGKQGIGKTSLFRILGGQWYKNYSGNLNNNDFYLLLRGAIILDLDEGATLYKTGAIKVKSSISQTYDEFRAPYARTTEKHLRRFVFAMTTNDAEPLQDTTGNRRYWMVDLKEKINFKWLEDNRDQLFAEAYYNLQNKIKVSEVPQAIAEERQEIHLSQDSWVQPITQFLESQEEYCEGSTEYSITVNEIFEKVLSASEGYVDFLKLNKGIEMRTAMILKNLGFLKKRTQTNKQQQWRWFLTDEKIKELKENPPEIIDTPNKTFTDF